MKYFIYLLVLLSLSCQRQTIVDESTVAFSALIGHWQFTNCDINGVNSIDSLQAYFPDYSFKITRSPWNPRQPIMMPFINNKPYTDYLNPSYQIVYNPYTMYHDLVPNYNIDIVWDEVSGYFKLQKTGSTSPMFYRSDLNDSGYVAKPFQSPFHIGAYNFNKVFVKILSEKEILITTPVNFNFKLWAEKL